MELSGKNILLISPESWGQNHVSKHHYATELSKNNKIYFLNPPSSKNNILQLNEGLTIIDYKPLIRGINRLPSFFRKIFSKLEINRLIKSLPYKIDIVWSFDPFRFQYLKLFNAGFTIYHPVDIHKTPLEKICIESSDIVFSSTTIILEKYMSLKKPMFSIGHGISNHFFSKKKVDVPEINNGRIKVAMMGNLSRKIDYEVLYKTINNHPNINFYFIGPKGESNLSQMPIKSEYLDKLGQVNNTYFLGSKPVNALPIILSKMDMFVMLYKKDENPATLANPHKVLEFFSTGKVLVSNQLSDYITNSHLIEMVEYNEEFPQKFNEVVQNLDYYNSPEKQAARIDFAEANTYDKKIRQIEELIQKHVRK
ncbi:MAG TPA: glycosyl transferase family 1 [Cytophagales bacterium]|jgi:hypothetical protein|nr:glycosyl transferase family 1 [Cytophagales bacterium]